MPTKHEQVVDSNRASRACQPRLAQGLDGCLLSRSELLRSHLLPRGTVAERMAEGKSLRDRVPRSSHAFFARDVQRVDPVAILEEQAQTRLPHLVPVRYARMLNSPFSFLRGAAAIMANDLATAPVSGALVQACGDAHLMNFGVFGSAERQLVFGINDFDETLPAPWEWDLKRLAASVVVCGRFMNAGDSCVDEAVRAMVGSYREHMREYAHMTHLDVWYVLIDDDSVLSFLSKKARKKALRVIEKARTRNHLQVLDKMTDLVDDEQRIVENPPLVVREAQSADGVPILETLDHFLHAYQSSLPEDRWPLFARYRIVDAANKVVGVGSVGTHCWVIYLTGNDADDPLFLQIKEAQPSVLEPYFEKSEYATHGQRVVVGQRMIQGAPDIFLGWGEINGKHFYVRQLRDMKGGFEFLPDYEHVGNFREYAALCGWGLSLAHAKSGDPALIAGYVGRGDTLDSAIAAFAHAYADQTELDHQALAAAAQRGAIIAEGE